MRKSLKMGLLGMAMGVTAAAALSSQEARASNSVGGPSINQCLFQRAFCENFCQHG
ncbi:MAG: hypothetical protein ABW123_14140 [Cystobacter sp.]